jgi:hypothetical protein
MPPLGMLTRPVYQARMWQESWWLESLAAGERLGLLWQVGQSAANEPPGCLKSDLSSPNEKNNASDLARAPSLR